MSSVVLFVLPNVSCILMAYMRVHWTHDGESLNCTCGKHRISYYHC